MFYADDSLITSQSIKSLGTQEARDRSQNKNQIKTRKVEEEEDRPETFKLSECEREHFGRAPVHFKRTDSTNDHAMAMIFVELYRAHRSLVLARNARTYTAIYGVNERRARHNSLEMQ